MQQACVCTCFPSRMSSAICSTSDAIRPRARVPSSRVTTLVPTLTTISFVFPNCSRFILLRALS